MHAMTGMSGMSGMAMGRRRAASFVPAAQDALLAAYYFTDGSGTTLTDSSGNARHGTLGGLAADGGAIGSPTWSASGLTFDGTQGVTLPLALAGLVKCVQYVSAPLANDSQDQRRAIVAWDTTPGGGFVSTWGPFHFLYPKPFCYPKAHTYQPVASYEPTYGTRCVTVQAGGTADAGVFNSSNRVEKYLANTGGAPASTSATVVTLGYNPSLVRGAGDAAGFKGPIYAVLLYDRDLTPAEAAANATGLEAMVAARGVTIGYTPTETGRQLIFDGDSITAGGWPDLLSLADTWVKYNFGISAQTAAEIAENAGRRVHPAISPVAAKVGYVCWAGTNDIALGVGTPAQAFASYVECVNDAITAGADFVVVLPMLSRTGWDTQKNAFNALYTAYSWPATVDVVTVAAISDLTDDGASAGVHFSDGVHPDASGNQIIADAVGPLVDARA